MKFPIPQGPTKHKCVDCGKVEATNECTGLIGLGLEDGCGNWICNECMANMGYCAACMKKLLKVRD